MKKQVIYGIEFRFENFDYSFARSLLSFFLRDRFPLYGNLNVRKGPTDRDTVEKFKTLFPHIKVIQIVKIKEWSSDQKMMEQYAITKLK